MNKMDERINKIQNEHEALLKKVRESIIDNKNNLTNDVSNLIKVIDIDKENIKKYKALLKAQELISDLTEEILNATSLDDILKTRNRLNYYINKIKTILASRNISPLAMTSYQEKVSYLRKDIAKYIRFLKRENKITKINHLHANYDNLNPEELKLLKKLVTLETNYNRRNKKQINNNISKNTNLAPVQKNMAINNTIKEPTPALKVENSPINLNVIEPSSNGEESVFANSVDNFNTRYKIANTYDYNSDNKVKNIIKFFQNIPYYIHNKRALKMMINDYNNYYSGSDLLSYIEYTKQRNSIIQGLKCIFNRTYLYNQDAIYLNDHEKCLSWILNFCKENSLDLPFDSYEVLKLNRSY